MQVSFRKGFPAPIGASMVDLTTWLPLRRPLIAHSLGTASRQNARDGDGEGFSDHVDALLDPRGV